MAIARNLNFDSAILQTLAWDECDGNITGLHCCHEHALGKLRGNN